MQLFQTINLKDIDNKPNFYLLQSTIELYILFKNTLDS